jgi:hypothetical protein
MRLARQTPCAEATVGKRHTTLPLHVHRSLRLCALDLGLILLLLCTRLLCITVDLALLALLCARFETFDSRLPGPDIVTIVFTLLFPQRCILGFLGFLLLSLLVCLLV